MSLLQLYCTMFTISRCTWFNKGKRQKKMETAIPSSDT